MGQVIDKRYEFILFFDVENGNPNGDPDAGNMPRIDPETGHGIVTDVCIKRKIRNYVDEVKEGTEGYEIYVKDGAVLNLQHKRAYAHLNYQVEPKKLPQDKEKAQALTAYMCENFFDIRTFGAVMSTEINCGVVRGPVQLNFAKSIDPIMQQEITITRVAVTKEGESKTNEMGRKHIVPYGLYRMEGYISANLAQKATGFSQDDLELFWEALINMFDVDHAAARGKMATRKLIVFAHDSIFGAMPSHLLFDKVQVETLQTPPRSFKDYNITIDNTPIEGVTVIEKL